MSGGAATPTKCPKSHQKKLPIVNLLIEEAVVYDTFQGNFQSLCKSTVIVTGSDQVSQSLWL